MPIIKRIWGVILGFISIGWTVCAWAQNSVSMDLMPLQIVEVKGDVSKFRAINWLNDGYSYGINALNIGTKVSKDTHIFIEGRSVPNVNDNDGSVLITKDHIGFIQTKYKSFRQYFDNSGGYYPYTTPSLQLIQLNQDLHLDVGYFALEIGNGIPGESTCSAEYDRDIKKGSEDHLTWTAVKANVTKYTGPSWGNNEETTDTVSLKNKAEVMGFTVKAKQSYGFFQSNRSRQEQSYYTDMITPSTDNKWRAQSLDTQTKSLTSTWLADRWMLNDQTYLSLGYRFAHLRDSQIEYLREYMVNGTLWNYSRPANKNGWGRNIQDSNIWTGNLVTNLTRNLSFGSKIKMEMVNTNGISTQGIDCGPANSNCSSLGAAGVSPNGAANYYYDGTSENKITGGAENFSLKYTGFSRTSLYADFDMEQNRNWESLYRRIYKGEDTLNTNVVGGDVYHDVINHAPEMAGTIGARITPIKSVSANLEYKHGVKNDKLDTVVENPSTEADLNVLRNIEDSMAARLTWKPLKWFENSFRVRTAGTVFNTQYAAQNMVKTQQMERDFTYGLTIFPTDAWMFTASYSLQLFKTSTPASQFASNSTVYLPVTTANVNTLAFSTSYAPTDNFSIFQTSEYSRAENGNNNYVTNNSAFLYSPDDEWYDAQVGAKWTVTKNIIIEPKYAYYAFRTYQSVETGNYSAHVMWLDVDIKW
ncbi:MAG: hypothetical protein HQL26_01980 [Candidatus Omnitrophica bacterium]|nr:hypothetical protein [Candidatus Omnitrophota bacterium]